MQYRDEEPAPPDGLSAELVATVDGLSPHDLRELIEYAQGRHQYVHGVSAQIEPQPGEEIVEVTDHGAYWTVVKRQPCGDDCPDCPHGPFVYHVTPESGPERPEHLHWTYIGRRHEE